MSDYLLLATLFAPLLAFLCLLAFGKKLPRQGDWLAIVATALGFLLSVVSCIQVFPNQLIHIQAHWFTVFVHTFKIGFWLDNVSAVMMVLVTGISLLVQVYSVSYMKEEIRYSRYFAYLCLFTFAMEGLILADSLFLLYFFWELVGLASYLLIGFWYEKREALNASRNAFLINRIGDTGLLLAIIFIHLMYGTSDIQFLINEAIFPEHTFWITLVGVGILCGAATKSAQFPMSIWLPPAMAGPTPVSALIHAATMVAAGIFLLIRCFPFLEENILTIITIMGTLTAFLGAFAGLFQTDIKKVLAYSTISQLGYMTAAVGVGAPDAALFHLVTHAFFKAGLFLCAGSVIHALHKAAHHMHLSDRAFDAQDMRTMGGLRKQLPFTFICYTICSLALAGLPLTSGFLSKDLILSRMLAWSWTNDVLKEAAIIIPVLGFLGVLFTALYTGRQLKLIFGGSPRYFQLFDDKLTYINELTEEVPFRMRAVTGILAVLSLFFWFSWLPWEPHAGWFLHTFASTFTERMDDSLPNPALTEAAHWYTLLLSLVLVAGGLALAIWRSGRANHWFPNLLRKVSFHFFYTEIIAFFIGTKSLKISKKSVYWLDRKVIDKLVDGIAILTVTIAHITAWLDRILVDGMISWLTYLAGRIGLLTKAITGNKIQGLFTAALVGLVLLVVWVVWK